MTTQETNAKPDALMAFNYCLGFIDLLGQREATRGQGLLPTLANEEEKKAFYDTIRNSIGRIRRLQTNAETMLRELIGERTDSPFRATLPDEQKPIWDQIKCTKITRQRWSDGLAIFVSLGDQEIKCPMNGIFGILGMCGTLCFLGLAMRQPVRGAIDVAWGVELNPGELYGPVVARAYELEAEVAQYPRIVVGPNVIGLLRAHADHDGNDHFSQLNRSLAQLCLEMVIRDIDGFPILHYLGEAFRKAISQDQHQTIYAKAQEFVIEQLEQHQRAANSKLAFRYAQLLHYFQAYPPPTGDSDEAPHIASGDASPTM
jgi:hypothetical protein